MHNNDVDLSSSYGPDSKTALPKMMQIPASLVCDRRLSLGARVTMIYLASVFGQSTSTVRISLAGVSDDLGVRAADLYPWLGELDEEGYLTLNDLPIEPGSPTRVALSWQHLDGWPGDEVSSLPDTFRETMETVTIPVNLQPYYTEIYLWLQQLLPTFVVPGNKGVLQGILESVSHSMKKGSIDERGPIGLIISIVRNAAKVPFRDFAAENQAGRKG